MKSGNHNHGSSWRIDINANDKLKWNIFSTLQIIISQISQTILLNKLREAEMNSPGLKLVFIFCVPAFHIDNVLIAGWCQIAVFLVAFNLIHQQTFEKHMNLWRTERMQSDWTESLTILKRTHACFYMH